MRTFRIIACVGAGLSLASCAFLLDFDELQDETGADAAAGGMAGASGSSGSAGAAASAGTSGAGGGAGVDLGQLAKTTAAAVCAKLEQCFGTPAMPLIFGDVDCEQALTAFLVNATFSQVAESAKVGKIKLNPSEVSACLNDFKALACRDVSFDFPAPCRKVVEGLVAKDQPCAHTLECQTGMYCSVTATGACPGKCAPFRESGEACSEFDPCAAGLGCTQGKCAPLAKKGEPCLGPTGVDCEVGAFCFGEKDEAPVKAGACVDTKGLFSVPLGQTCSYWFEAASNPTNFKLCQAGVCPVFDLIPGTRLCSGFLATPGSPCRLSIPDPCPSGQYCDGSLCTDLPGNGEDCLATPSVKGRCKAGHSCNGISCDVQRPNGQTCGSDEQCFSGRCDLGPGKSNECVPPGCPVTP